MIKAIVAGAAGRMGGRIIHMVDAADGIALAAAFEKSDHSAVGRDVGEVVGLPPKGIPVAGSLAEVLERGEVILDFTNPEASLSHLKQAAPAGKAMVIGTTGFSADQLAEIKQLAQGKRVVLAPNMSVGVNLMFKVVQDIARVLSSGFDVEIIEAHHHLKKDAPSGTAMKLAQLIAQSLNRDLDKVGVYERRGMIGERSPEEIGIQTVRAGDIVGEHTVIFGGVGERLEIIHRAHNRDNFARGAVRAAQWIVTQPSGFYDMQDVLGLR
jgi:4-hydroxy-tetrahydrodipicolinate reductase